MIFIIVHIVKSLFSVAVSMPHYFVFILVCSTADAGSGVSHDPFTWVSESPGWVLQCRCPG